MRWSLCKHGSSSHVNCFLAVNESLTLVVTGQMVDTVGNPLSKIPELTMRQDDQDGQEDELVARLLVLLCPSGGRRFRKLVRIHKLILGIAGGIHVGKDDLDVGAGDQSILFGYAGEETGGTKVRSLMIGLDAVSQTAILL